LLFDLIEDDGTPPPQPPYQAANNIPSWCRGLNCKEMPTELRGSVVDVSRRIVSARVM
jgi:hypothetical protein